MSFVRENLHMFDSLTAQSQAIAAQKSIALPHLKQVVTDALQVGDEAPLDVVDFVYPVNSAGALCVVYQWSTDTYNEDLIINAEDLTAERPGIAYRHRLIAERQGRKDEETRLQLEKARAKVTELEALLGE